MRVVLVVRDATDQDHVVAGLDLLFQATIEPGNNAIEDRRTRRSPAPVDRIELVFAGTRETIRQVALVAGKHVDREPPRPREYLAPPGGRGDIDQHQRRLERYRGERVGGKTAGFARLVESRHDRDAGHETAEGATQVARIVAAGADVNHDPVRPANPGKPGFRRETGPVAPPAPCAAARARQRRGPRRSRPRWLRSLPGCCRCRFRRS